MSLKSDLNKWDGRHIDDLDDVYYKHKKSRSFIPRLLKLLDEPGRQREVAWLIKQYVKRTELSPAFIKNIYSSLPKLVCWQSRIQILQIMPFMPVARSEKKQVEKFVRSCLNDKIPIVRAWALNGFFELSLQYGEYKEEAARMIYASMENESPSVISRIRNIIRENPGYFMQ